MDFKIGDIVRIRGGVDEWEVIRVNDKNMYVLLNKDGHTNEANVISLELVRRPGEERVASERNDRYKHVSELLNKWANDPSDYDARVWPLLKEVLDPKKCDETPKTGQESVECEHGSWSTKDGGKTRRCVTCDKIFIEPKKKVERWQWILLNLKSRQYQKTEYMTEQQVQYALDTSFLNGKSFKLISKDPNCLKPLITEE